MKLRPPAIPLITVDPYFSVWSFHEKLNYTPTVHWTGAEQNIQGIVTVDGCAYSFFGYHRNARKLPQISLDVDALSTAAVFENEAIRLTAVWTSPLLPDDLHRMTRPVSYLTVSYAILDGQSHDVTISVSVSEQICLNHRRQSRVIKEEVALPHGLKGARMGNSVQKPLNRAGDDLRIDWGYFYLASNHPHTVVETPFVGWNDWVKISAAVSENDPMLILFAYDDVESIEYFHQPLRSWWNKDGMTIEAAIAEAAAEYDSVKARCDAFSAKLYRDAVRVGGEQYGEILSLAYRQVIAAHKLVLDENKEILFISKECFSNGCAVTVDVSYPSIPMFLLYNPELVKGMLRPIYRYAQSEAWPYDFAPHDVGTYPLVNGQTYGNNKLEYQMPVEECGNVLIMETNIALATGSADFAAEHLDTLVKWCDYLLKYGADPGEQLCTDDFAGHLAHNCNLALKAIMGIQGMSILMKMLGRTEDAAKYQADAHRMAENWLVAAKNDDGSTRLAFDRPGTFAMKYNMVWDKVWHTNLFGQEFMDQELAHNMTRFNTYGMPLDSRADYTKSDWLVWTASMASEQSTFEAFIAPLWKAYNESFSRVPLTDWFDAVSSRTVEFQHRSVQGGLFMRMLLDAWADKTTEVSA